MAIIQDWKIRTTNAQCELTEEPFLDEQVFYTCIFDDPESDGFLRRDYSVESWEKIHEEINPPPFSFWKSTYKAPVKEEEEKRIEDTSAEGLLRRFIEQDDPKTEHARYILALMLERKKSLVQTDSKETETRTLLFYEQEGTGDVFIVADPGLKLDEIEVVQQEVASLLAAEEAKASQHTVAQEEPLEEPSGEETKKADETGAEPAQSEE